jgi:hypothetical protein
VDVAGHLRPAVVVGVHPRRGLARRRRRIHSAARAAPKPAASPASYHRAPRAAPEPAATSATSHSAGAASTPQPVLLCRERVRVGCGDFWGESEGMRGNKTKLEFFREGFTK